MSGIPNSPLFPALQLTLSPPVANSDEIDTYVPALPDKPLSQTSSIQVYIIPTEKTLFVQGFDANEYAERPPTLIRGSLYIRVLKPSKIRAITLSFKGQQRTEWPEGIPPKRNTFTEINDIVSHTWPFYQQGQVGPNNGADVFRELSHATVDHDVSNLALTDTFSRSSSPAPESSPSASGNFFTRNLSPSFVRRAASPSIGDSSLIFTELTTNISGGNDDSKTGYFPVGDYIYNFEHPLPPSTPESCSVTFGTVQYHFDATITRLGTFKSNISARLPIDIVRLPSESNLEENEPIVITRDWEDQLRYDIVIGGKSVILDAYLPLAFRFVPLWGKVALHRIRVYFTENLEYYCQNKKVHRMEPPKKYLLLEHKASKGKSLLSANVGTDQATEGDIEDDVLPRELEFQLFVPRVLNGKFEHEIHPDTSLENIQAHHWIKICLRISKKDPENPEKRKHYEILIDSPIHVLSPKAAHGNTLLPAYDYGHLSLPVYDESSPPMSPNVFAIDGTHTPNSILPGLPSHQNTSNSLDAVMDSQESIFHHINSSSNNDEPIERDGNMHLEANLYKPDKDNERELHSPQAVPHPGTFHSPLNSPIQRPIHLIRNPSINPPPFNADLDPATALSSAPPPAYEREDPRSLSLSPLRIDNSRSSERRRVSTSENRNVNIIPPTPVLETPIKDMLILQFSPNPSVSEAQNNLSNSMGANKTLEEVLLPRTIESSIDLLRVVTPNDTVDLNEPEGEDITDTPGSPLQPPQSLSVSNSSNALSRRSSVSSFNSLASDLPVDQTIPLLTLSSSSINTGATEYEENHASYRNGSVNSLVYDFSARTPSHPNVATSSLMDMVDGGDLSEGFFEFHGNLHGLRNPRIKKHYQEFTDPFSKNKVTDPRAESSNSLQKKERQKSFGVVNTPTKDPQAQFGNHRDGMHIVAMGTNDNDTNSDRSSSNDSEFTINEEGISESSSAARSNVSANSFKRNLATVLDATSAPTSYDVGYVIE